jgi:hypothetical protein
MLRMQYSAAQNTVPVSKEGVLTPDEEPEVQGEEPQVLEPQVQGEEPRADKDGSARGTG